jgi:hypothetical protein
MSTIDYNADNYTVSELFEILGLDDPTSDEIINNTNSYIKRFSPSRENRPELVNFFQSIQTKLLRYMQQLENSGKDAEYTPNEKQTDEWYKYESLPQDNPIQKDKITERIQKIDVYDNNHVPMNRQQLGVNNNFQVPVSQDTLNPNLENITSRFINLDSQFRQASGGSESMSTDYTMDLSDPLTDVLSLRLYSIQIPYTWYTIDYVYGNTCFWVTNAGSTFKIFIEPGNYTPTEFCSALNNAFTSIQYFQPPYTITNENPSGITYAAPFTYSGVSSKPDIARYNSNNGKITLYLDGWYAPYITLADRVLIKTITQYTDTFNAETDAYFTFFDITGTKSCYESGTYPCAASGNQGHTFDGTLGWLMGFRLPLQPIFSTGVLPSQDPNYLYTGGNTPQGILNLYGTKYFIVVLDDYNQNHINNGLITITELSKSLPLPSYYNSSQPYICSSNTTNLPSILDINALGNLSNVTPAQAASLGVNPDNLFNSLQDKVDFGTGKIQQILPSAPRTLTQAQIYTINEIIKNRNKTISFRAKAPTNSDTFAIIPIKYGSLSTGQLYTEVSGQFQDNKRVYFGPVDIDRLRITLLDDRGNVVDLHGGDWCVTLISENLYQY